MRLLELLEGQRSDAATELEAILERAATDDGRELTEAEDANAAELRSQIDRLTERITSAEADHERSVAAQRERTPRAAVRREQSASEGVVTVRSDPGVYGDGPEGLRRFLVDMAVVSRSYESGNPDYSFDAANERMLKHRAQAQSDTAPAYARAVATDERMRGHVAPHALTDPVTHERAVSMGSLAGIVHEQFDPSMTRRGVYPRAVTTRLANRYGIFAEGDKLTLPRVNSKAAAAVQAEGSNFHDTGITTQAVTADLVTIGAKAEISVQAVERGNMSVELLSDELGRAWMTQLNAQVLIGAGSSANPDQLQGLLTKPSTRDGQFITVTKSSPSAADQLGYLTDAKTAIATANLMPPDCYVVSPGMVGRFEQAQTSGGEFLIPPWAAWVQNMGGAGAATAEGVMSAMEWRRVPIYSDSQILDTWKADDSAQTGGAETRVIAMTGPEMPIFYNGPMTYTYDQTLAASGQVLLVVRGYVAFNPMWAPESWRILHGTGMTV